MSELFFDQDISTLADLTAVYERLLPQLRARALLLFIGEAGAGKTTSVQIIASLIDIDSVVSPTFGIHHRYENSRAQVLDHVDLYRLTDPADLESTGFWDILAQAQGWVAIEWADRLDMDSLPMNWQQVFIQLKANADKSRSAEADASNSLRHLRIEIKN